MERTQRENTAHYNIYLVFIKYSELVISNSYIHNMHYAIHIIYNIVYQILYLFLFIIIGGRQGKLPVKAFEVYDFSTNKWQKLADIPSKRVFAMYTASDTHVFSVGGLNENPRDGFSATCEAYDIANGKSVHQENPLYGFSATCEAYDIETVNLCIKRTPRTVSRLHVKPCVIANGKSVH